VLLLQIEPLIVVYRVGSVVFLGTQQEEELLMIDDFVPPSVRYKAGGDSAWTRACKWQQQQQQQRHQGRHVAVVAGCRVCKRPVAAFTSTASSLQTCLLGVQLPISAGCLLARMIYCKNDHRCASTFIALFLCRCCCCSDLTVPQSPALLLRSTHCLKAPHNFVVLLLLL
jgi:hypothetical protein